MIILLAALLYYGEMMGLNKNYLLMLNVECELISKRISLIVPSPNSKFLLNCDSALRACVL